VRVLVSTAACLIPMSATRKANAFSSVSSRGRENFWLGKVEFTTTWLHAAHGRIAPGRSCFQNVLRVESRPTRHVRSL